MEAAWGGQEETINLLLDFGANINDVDDHGMTSLIRAARIGHEKVVKALLSRGIDTTGMYSVSLLGQIEKLNVSNSEDARKS